MAAPQRSDDWFRARLGVFTAGSTFKTIMHGYAKGKRSLVLTKAAEVLTGEWQEATAASLEWGKSHEADALAMYEFMYGENVQEEGLVLHPDHARAGCSPDGLVREDGGIEIKCPQTSREHVRNLLEGMDWKEYGPQVQGCMWVTGRQWWDFISYDPRMPPPARFHCERIHRDEEYIAELEGKVLEVVDSLDETILQLLEDDLHALDGGPKEEPHE